MMEDKKTAIDLINTLKSNFEGYIDGELLKIKPDIEPDPSIGLIKELLGEVPAQIERIQGILIEVKKFMMDYKIMIKSAKTKLEIEKSRIRTETLNAYQKELKDSIIKAEELFADIKKENKKLPTALVQEMLKVMRPEKPTQNYLDDVANLKTEELQNKIHKYEMDYNNIEKQVAMLESLVERYQNKLISVRGHRSLKQEEMRNNLQ